VLKAIADQGRFSEVTVYAIDIDADPQNAHLFGVGTDSTMVAFEGQKEIARVVGDASPETIEILLRSTMQGY
jgi:thioredoxin 1